MNRKNPIPATALAAACCAGIASPATAANAVLQGREAVLYTSYLGGFAIAVETGEAGSLTPFTAALPTALSRADRWTFSDTYLSFTIDVFTQWNLAQEYAVDASSRSFAGRGAMGLDVGGAVFGPGCNPCMPSAVLTGHNQQALEFRLDSDTRYNFSSTTTPNQWVDLMRWDSSQGRWERLWDGFGQTQGVTFSSSGNLLAGRYRVQNNPGSVTVDETELSNSSAWEWTLTLPEASVSAVPEPGSWLLMTAGLLALGRAAVTRRQA